MTYRCKVCGNECLKGEKHLCGACWQISRGSSGYASVAQIRGECIRCKGLATAVQAPAYAFQFACRNCFNQIVRYTTGIDVSGPEVPYAPVPLPATGSAISNLNGLLKALYPTPSFTWVGSGTAATVRIPHDWADDATPVPRSSYESCNTCSVEMSPELDSYPGRDQFKAGMCVKCRDRIFGRYCNDDSDELDEAAE